MTITNLKLALEARHTYSFIITEPQHLMSIIRYGGGQLLVGVKGSSPMSGAARLPALFYAFTQN